jgi:hypothetical protein
VNPRAKILLLIFNHSRAFGRAASHKTGQSNSLPAFPDLNILLDLLFFKLQFVVFAKAAGFTGEHLPRGLILLQLPFQPCHRVVAYLSPPY